MFQQFGRILMVVGVLLVAAGALMWLGGRLGLGSLPGDFSFRGERWGCYLPIVSSIVISIVLTLLLNLILRIFR